mmetsp:Transcript_68426/g.154982  ORF Transcript_68426/g.154982 Transcript_68426/m.154982 type:complete len:272 (+) Transcript_68426:756-1571(+)
MLRLLLLLGLCDFRHLILHLLRGYLLAYQVQQELPVDRVKCLHWPRSALRIAFGALCVLHRGLRLGLGLGCNGLAGPSVGLSAEAPDARGVLKVVRPVPAGRLGRLGRRRLRPVRPCALHQVSEVVKFPFEMIQATSLISNVCTTTHLDLLLSLVKTLSPLRLQVHQAVQALPLQWLPTFTDHPHSVVDRRDELQDTQLWCWGRRGPPGPHRHLGFHRLCGISFVAVGPRQHVCLRSTICDVALDDLVRRQLLNRFNHCICMLSRSCTATP